jgi:outer membrane lipoprotein SlyB
MKRFAIVAICLAFSMSGCANIAAGLSNVAATVAGASPTQATTLGQAEQLATVATDAADVAVNTGKLPVATLKELAALNAAVHAAVTDLEAANAAGQSLNFAAFNAALQAFNAYKTANGAT